MGDGSADQIMTLSEVAEYLKVSEKTILRMVQSGQFPGMKVSSQWRFLRTSVDEWLTAKMNDYPKQDLVDLVNMSAEVVPLTRLISNDRILLDVKPGSKNEILGQLVAPLQREGVVGDSADYLQRLIKREEMVSTAIGNGLAIPHVREPQQTAVHMPCIVLGICPRGTDFEALDGQPTRVLAVPCSASETAHLHLMARISIVFRRPGVLESMTQARTKQDVMQLLAEADRDLTNTKQATA